MYYERSSFQIFLRFSVLLVLHVFCIGSMIGSTGSIYFSIDSLAWVAAVLCVATASVHFSMDSLLRAAKNKKAV